MKASLSAFCDSSMSPSLIGSAIVSRCGCGLKVCKSACSRQAGDKNLFESRRSSTAAPASLPPGNSGGERCGTPCFSQNNVASDHCRAARINNGADSASPPLLSQLFCRHPVLTPSGLGIVFQPLQYFSLSLPLSTPNSLDGSRMEGRPVTLRRSESPRSKPCASCIWPSWPASMCDRTVLNRAYVCSRALKLIDLHTS
jgi:hypothetical protein